MNTPETKQGGSPKTTVNEYRNGGYRPCILFADDDRDTLDLLEAAARLRGWECDTVTDSDGIIEMVTKRCANGGRCYDCLVLDITFQAQGQVSGVQATRALRRAYPDIPVIFITGWTGRLVKEEALRVGQEYIVKPLDPNFVLDRCEVWMLWAGNLLGRYEGPERRARSINRSGQYRRVVDRPIAINRRVSQAVAEGQQARSGSIGQAQQDVVAQGGQQT